MTPLRPSSALPPAALHGAVPKGISGRASYLHVCLAFHSLPQVIATFFNRLPFGPPRGFTPVSACPWQDHIGFGSAGRDLDALFRLAFAPAPGLQSLCLAAPRDSQAYSTKDTPRRPLPARHLVGPGFRVLFHSPQGGSFRLSLTVLFATGGAGCSALDRGRPGFTRGSSCPALLRYRDTEAECFRLRGSHPLWPRFPAGSPALRLLHSAGHPLAALQPRSGRFGLLPLRSPLLGESLLISLPALLRWFTSRSLAPPHYFIRARGARLAACGLPHSGTRGSKDVCSSPRLFAACRALHRTGSPGRPPRTSLSLGHIVPSRARHHMASSARLLHSAFPSLCVSNIFFYSKSMENTGLEPVTYSLQSYRSSQVS